MCDETCTVVIAGLARKPATNAAASLRPRRRPCRPPHRDLPCSGGARASRPVRTRQGADRPALLGRSEDKDMTTDIDTAALLAEANAHAQRRFHAMLEAKTYSDPEAPETIAYIQAERIIDDLLGEAQWEASKAE